MEMVLACETKADCGTRWESRPALRPIRHTWSRAYQMLHLWPALQTPAGCVWITGCSTRDTSRPTTGNSKIKLTGIPPIVLSH